MPSTEPVGSENLESSVTYTVENLSLASIAQDRHFAELGRNQDPAVVSLVEDSVGQGELSEINSEDEATPAASSQAEARYGPEPEPALFIIGLTSFAV